MGADFDDTSESPVNADFDRASDFLTTIAGTLDEATLLYFYARYKQATVGPCNSPKPGFFDFKGHKKWSAWKELKEMTSDEARKQYVAKLTSIHPDWLKSSRSVSATGRSVSRMLPSDEGDVTNGKAASGEEEEVPIFKAVKDANLEEVKAILARSPNDVNLTDEEGMTPLHWAADRGLLEVVQTLAAAQIVDLNVQDKSGQTPLHYACSCDHVTVCNLLLQLGAKSDIADRSGQLACDLISAQHRPNLIGV